MGAQLEWVRASCHPDRVARLPLPADFSINGDHGIYIVEDKRAAGEGVWARKRFDDSAGLKKVPEEFVGDLELVNNYSLKRGELRDTTGRVSYTLAWLFASCGSAAADEGGAANPAAATAEVVRGELAGAAKASISEDKFFPCLESVFALFSR